MIRAFLLYNCLLLYATKFPPEDLQLKGQLAARIWQGGRRGWSSSNWRAVQSWSLKLQCDTDSFCDSAIRKYLSLCSANTYNNKLITLDSYNHDLYN